MLQTENDLSHHIQSVFELNESVLTEVASNFQEVEFPQNYFLLKQGRICNSLWIIAKGAARFFYTNELGKETNVWFSFEGEFVTDVPSFSSQSASEESIQLLEDSKLFVIDYRTVQALLQKHHAFALWYIKLIEKHYMFKIEDRLGDLQFLSAKQHYQKLLEMYPEITQRISLGHIASYLNITQATLSRLRAGKI